MNNRWTAREGAKLWQRCDESAALLPKIAGMIAGVRLECYAPAPKTEIPERKYRSWPMKATS